MAKFCYYNRNDDKIERNDCVSRAISLASGLKFSTIRKKLRNTASLLDCEISLCPTCYGFLIQEVLGGTPKNCEGMTVGEFANNHPIGTYLIRISGHLTCVIDCVCYDIWNCLDRECDLAWQIR
jgi:hypothetical protein